MTGRNRQVLLTMSFEQTLEDVAKTLVQQNPEIKQQIEPAASPLSYCTSIWEFFAISGLYTLKALVIVALFAWILKSSWVREFLSPMYVSGRIMAGMVDDISEKYQVGDKPRLSMEVSIFLGLCCVGFLHFAASIFSALFSLFGSVLHTAPIC